jgi:hypothetical protein
MPTKNLRIYNLQPAHLKTTRFPRKILRILLARVRGKEASPLFSIFFSIYSGFHQDSQGLDSDMRWLWADAAAGLSRISKNPAKVLTRNFGRLAKLDSAAVGIGGLKKFLPSPLAPGRFRDWPNPHSRRPAGARSRQVIG